MSSSATRILALAICTVALSSSYGQAAHADWRCHIHPNAAATADTSGVAAGKDGANHPSESARFNFGKIEQTYTQQK